MPLNSRTDSNKKADPVGTLFVLATPIGNMEDITLRAIRTLQEVALVAAEDTRHTRKLFSRHGISTPITSYHDHNKEQRTPGLIKKLKSGQSIALVTDAGTPAISDPGYYLVRAAVHAHVPVVPIPGASAVVAALSVSGLPTDSFVFVGFVPRKGSKRKQLLKELKDEFRTLIFFESPKRLLGLMGDVAAVMGDRNAAVARELTKVHEEVLRGPISDITARLAERPSLKGECTFLVQGYEKARDVDPNLLLKDLKLRIEAGHSMSDCARELAEKYRVSRKVVYDEGLKLKKKRRVRDEL